MSETKSVVPRNILFDSVKGIAILWIMLVHFAIKTNVVTSNMGYIFTFVSKGSLGVELTFIVNAFFSARYFCNMRNTGVSMNIWGGGRSIH